MVIRARILTTRRGAGRAGGCDAMHYIRRIISCNDVALGAFLPEYLSNEIDPLGGIMLEEHVSSCPSCYAISSDQSKIKYRLPTVLSRLVRDARSGSKKDWLLCISALLFTGLVRALSAKGRQTGDNEQFSSVCLRGAPLDPWADFLRHMGSEWARGNF